MSGTSIPKSIQEIIDVINSRGFRPITYKDLAEFLKKDPNTLVQRINRNSEYFTIKGDRPKIIELNKECNEIFFYRDENKCQICQKEFDPDELTIRYRDSLIKKNKDAWDNIITCCSQCKTRDLTKKLSTTYKPAPYGNKVWEYKEIEIREVSKLLEPTLGDIISKKKYVYETHWEFNEFSGEGWFRLHDEKDDTCENVSDILNYFGSQGWNLISIKEDYYFESQDIAGYYCFFKRIKNGDDINEKTK